jgi:predicted GNAT family acetyltransferase
MAEVITHGVASVYTNTKHRGRGYASRLMRELGEVLLTWKPETTSCVVSVLFSDIGKKFYTKLGWRAFPSYHVEFDPLPGKSPQYHRY